MHEPVNLRDIRTLFFLALVAVCLSGWVSPPMALATGLVFALVVGNPLPRLAQKTAKLLLQASVVGLGFGMNLGALLAAGRTGIGFTVCSIGGTLLLGWWVGRMLRVETQASTLVSCGTAICGGSAIAAVAGVIKADSRAVSVALGTVFLLNAVALFIFPPIGHWLHLTQNQFGVWSAIAIHDTSSVVGAAAKYGDEALRVATTIKLVRALWIVPLALGLAFFTGRKGARIAWPWFILFFVAAACVRTGLPQGEPVYVTLVWLARVGLTLTLFLIGAQISREALHTVGWRALVQGLILWIVISIAGLLTVWRWVDGTGATAATNAEGIGIARRPTPRCVSRLCPQTGNDRMRAGIAGIAPRVPFVCVPGDPTPPRARLPALACP